MQSKFKIIALVLGATVLSACGSSNKDKINEVPSPPTSSIATEYQGIWVSSAYADVLNIKSDSVQLYKYTTDYCILQDSFDDLSTSELARSVKLSDDNNALSWIAGYGTKDFGAPSRELIKQSTMPASCDNNILTRESVLSNTEWFNVYSQIMEEYYVDFNRMGVDWVQLSYDLSLTITSNRVTLYDAINESFIALQDGHNTFKSIDNTLIQVLAKPTHVMSLIEEYATQNELSYPLDESEITANVVTAINAFIDEALITEQDILLNYATSTVQQDPTEQISWFNIGEIGYVKIDAMTAYSIQNDDSDDLAHTTSALNQVNAALDDVLSDFANTSGLIIDIRANGGGNDYISLAIASRFTDNEFVGYKKYARDGSGTTETKIATITPSDNVQYTNKPIVLLVSEETASAAEVFALSMSQLDFVTLIGKPTQGIFSDVLEFALPNSHQLGISNEVYLTPDDEWLEGEGVPVDIEVEYFSKSDRDTGKDSGMLSALEILQ